MGAEGTTSLKDVKIEKPPILYHGSTSANITEFKPQRRHVPSQNVGKRVYATDVAAFAAAHSFPWVTEEGFDLSFQGSTVVFTVPTEFKERLNVRVSIYELPSETFEHTTEEGTGHTFHSTVAVKPEFELSFKNVHEAVKHFGGQVQYKE